MREKEMYRDNLMEIREAFPGKRCLTVQEVGEWLGIDRRSVTKLIEEKKLPAANVSAGATNKVYRVSIESLARFLS